MTCNCDGEDSMYCLCSVKKLEKERMELMEDKRVLCGMALGMIWRLSEKGFGINDKLLVKYKERIESILNKH